MAGGYSINPSSTGVAGLDNYFDAGQKSDSGGTRGSVTNIATGKSNLSATTAEGKKTSLTTYAIIGGVILLGLAIYKGKI